jgi:hypothetical protein
MTLDLYPIRRAQGRPEEALGTREFHRHCPRVHWPGRGDVYRHRWGEARAPQPRPVRSALDSARAWTATAPRSASGVIASSRAPAYRCRVERSPELVIPPRCSRCQRPGRQVSARVLPSHIGLMTRPAIADVPLLRAETRTPALAQKRSGATPTCCAVTSAREADV